jgi:hypothetical protein
MDPVETNNNSIDLEKRAASAENAQRETSQNSQMSSDAGSPPDKLAEDRESLSRIESAASTVFDIAARVPTNASRESGIIGMSAFALLMLGWEGEDDPMNPRNWPLWRKGVVVGIISAITFFSPLASSMFAPGIPSVMKDFDTTNESLGTFTVSVYILVRFSLPC